MMWNQLDLKCPVDDVCEYGIEDGLILQDLPNFVGTLTTSAELLAEENPIWTEMKVLENIQAKYKRILHCDKSLQLLQKVGTCMRKMVLLNLSKSYLDLAEHFLVGLQSSNAKILLPSRQQLEFILIRTQSSAKLVCESLHYSRETFCFLIQRLKVGHLILNLLTATSVTARINLLFKAILLQIFDIYKKLYSWSTKLKIGTWEWPQQLNLPEDLEVWLVPEAAELLKPKHVPNEQLQFLNRFLKKKHRGIDRNSIKQIIDIGGKDESVILGNGTDTVIIGDNDFGEVISRPEQDTDIQVVSIAGKDSDMEVMSVQDSDVELISRFGEDGDIEVIPSPLHRKNKKKDAIPTPKNQRTASPMAEQNSSTPVPVTETPILTQNQLLQKIKAVTTYKELSQIWKSIDASTVNLLPEVLLPAKIRTIDKLFLALKRKIRNYNDSYSIPSKRKGAISLAVKCSALKFAKQLGFSELSSEETCANTSVESLNISSFRQLKPVYTLKGLRKLYEKLYSMLSAAQQEQRCMKLKKRYRSRRADIKLLIESGDKSIAKNLVFCTSKVFLTKFHPFR